MKITITMNKTEKQNILSLCESAAAVVKNITDEEQDFRTKFDSIKQSGDHHSYSAIEDENGGIVISNVIDEELSAKYFKLADYTIWFISEIGQFLKFKIDTFSNFAKRMVGDINKMSKIKSLEINGEPVNVCSDAMIAYETKNKEIERISKKIADLSRIADKLRAEAEEIRNGFDSAE